MGALSALGLDRGYFVALSAQAFLCVLCLMPASGNAAYRKSALEHHPDKAGAATADEDTKSAIEEKFKSIQEAYETLSDPAKRREFDSTDDLMTPCPQTAPQTTS